ncbi:hypothetical protein BRN38_12450 [Xanthomonas oryzae pv. oryzae]|nr:hypothetical protein BRN38_12450 [Xanthomonas oryzae pv. oryzae]
MATGGWSITLTKTASACWAGRRCWSGFHHNMFGGFLSLQLGVYAARQGEVVLREFRYRALA